MVGLEEKPAEPKSDLAATASYSIAPSTSRSSPGYLEEGNPPDAPGNFMVWLHTREPVYGYRAEGEWHDIGDLGQLVEADNMMRQRAACRSARNIH